MIFYNDEDRRQAVADLRAGADVIERNGWHQGYYWLEVAGTPDRDCPVCALGGLNVAINGNPRATGSLRRYRAAEALEDHIDAYVPGWNDKPGQTAENVIKAMRACADRLEAGA